MILTHVLYIHQLTMSVHDWVIHVNEGEMVSIVNVIPVELPQISCMRKICVQSPVIGSPEL